MTSTFADALVCSIILDERIKTLRIYARVFLKDLPSYNYFKTVVTNGRPMRNSISVCCTLYIGSSIVRGSNRNPSI